jgi:hypothetical protein
MAPTHPKPKLTQAPSAFFCQEKSPQLIFGIHYIGTPLAVSFSSPGSFWLTNKASLLNLENQIRR